MEVTQRSTSSPREDIFLVTPTTLELGLVLCKLSLKMQTLTLVFHASTATA